MTSSLQVEEIVMSQDSDNSNILCVAVDDESPDMFKVVMSCLEHYVGSTEVWNMDS